MFQPGSAFTYKSSNFYDESDYYSTGAPPTVVLPDLSPEAKISEHDRSQIAFFAQKALNGSLDYLIINVFGSGANLPVSCQLPIKFILFMAIAGSCTFDFRDFSFSQTN